MEITSEDWSRLGRRFVAARSALGLDQRSVARLASVGKRTVEYVEQGRAWKKGPTPSVYKLARFYGWAPEYVDEILARPTQPDAALQLLAAVQAAAPIPASVVEALAIIEASPDMDRASKDRVLGAIAGALFGTTLDRPNG